MARQGLKVVAATCNCNCIECRNEHHGDCPWECDRTPSGEVRIIE